ncbi:hypothetical protein ACLOJK_000890, partial [Asimina triloba]
MAGGNVEILPFLAMTMVIAMDESATVSLVSSSGGVRFLFTVNDIQQHPTKHLLHQLSHFWAVLGGQRMDNGEQ